MKLKRLQLYQFRNYEKVDLCFSPHLNLLTGANGTGKTNLLEAVYVASRLRSFRTQSMQRLIKHGQAGFSLKLAFSPHLHESSQATKSSFQHPPEHLPKDPPQGNLILSLHKGVKTLTLNDESLTPGQALKQTPKVILFTSDDIYLVQGSATLRRAFMDQAITQHYPEYKTALETYTKALRNRNKDIKRRKPFQTWDATLARTGIQLLARRETFIRALTKHAGPIFKALTSDSAQTDMTLAYAVTSRLSAAQRHSYRESVHTSTPEILKKSGENAPPPATISLTYEDYLDILAAHLEHDSRRGYTVFGPHSDDLIIKLRGHPAQGYASQGESRTLAHALKLSVFKMLDQRFQYRPIVLLDDIFSELDASKLKHLMGWITQQTQALLTCAQPQLLLPYMQRGAVFKTSNANVSLTRKL